MYPAYFFPPKLCCMGISAQQVPLPHEGWHLGLLPNREAVFIPGGLRVCVASGAQAHCVGAEGTNHTESRNSAQGERETWLLWFPHGDSGRGRTVQQDLLLRLSPALVKIIVVLLLRILRWCLEIASYCSFSAPSISTLPTTLVWA